MRSYEVARKILSFLEFCAWFVVVIGVVIALIGAGGGSRYGGVGAGFLAMAPGIGIGMAGLMLVAFVQMARATVDTAEYTQQMLKISRDQLEVSKQGLKQGGHDAAGFVVRAAEASLQAGPSFGEMNKAEQAQIKSPIAALSATTSEQITAQPTDQNGFLSLNEDGSLLEYRGRKFDFIDGKYDLAGHKFSDAQRLIRYMNGLKDLSA
jgi:hypothetical protein